MKIGKGKKASSEIPTSSTADIAFLLIVFFMVTTVFSATRGLDFDLPKEDESAQAIEAVEAVYIQIEPDGTLLVDKTPMEVSQLLDYLEPKLKIGVGNPNKPVIIRPDPAAIYAALVDVYDELKTAEKRGFEVKNISIPTQREIEEYIVKFGINPFDI
ncbi:MAG: biopolymer transporter ExbD [Acidobacteriota bacterium]